MAIMVEQGHPGGADSVTRARRLVLTEWAAQERLCCPFLDIDVRFEREGGPVWLRLGGRPGTKEFLRVDFAVWTRN